jgi:hypothetical protein
LFQVVLHSDLDMHTVAAIGSRDLARERRPVGNVGLDRSDRVRLAGAAVQRVAEHVVELRGQLLDDLLLTLGRHRGQPNPIADVGAPIRHFRSRG